VFLTFFFSNKMRKCW